MKSIKLEDVFNHIASDVVILKIDIEGYECKALQPEILMNKFGKFIPYIFMEWGQLPKNNKAGSQFAEWVQQFHEGGYIPLNPGVKEIYVIPIFYFHILATMERFEETERDNKWNIIAWVHSSIVGNSDDVFI